VVAADGTAQTAGLRPDLLPVAKAQVLAPGLTKRTRRIS
jgi:hypothetical protein